MEISLSCLPSSRASHVAMHEFCSILPGPQKAPQLWMLEENREMREGMEIETKHTRPDACPSCPSIATSPRRHSIGPGLAQSHASVSYSVLLFPSDWRLQKGLWFFSQELMASTLGMAAMQLRTEVPVKGPMQRNPVHQCAGKRVRKSKKNTRLPRDEMKAAKKKAQKERRERRRGQHPNREHDTNQRRCTK